MNLSVVLLCYWKASQKEKPNENKVVDGKMDRTKCRSIMKQNPGRDYKIIKTGVKWYIFCRIRTLNIQLALKLSALDQYLFMCWRDPIESRSKVVNLKTWKLFRKYSSLKVDRVAKICQQEQVALL